MAWTDTTKNELSKRIKEIKGDSEFVDELKVLNWYSDLIIKDADLKKQIKEVESNLDKQLLTKYKSLSEDEIKELVVEDKWLAALNRQVVLVFRLEPVTFDDSV